MRGIAVRQRSRIHKPVDDYWSKQSDTVRNATDKDAFNAAVNTLIHAEEIGTASEGKKYATINNYFNYAVFSESEKTDKMNSVVSAAQDISAYGHRLSVGKKDGCYVINASPIKANIKEAVAPAIGKITDNMSDKEKIKICVDYITSKFSYGEGQGGFTWTSGNTGVCGDFSLATHNILSVAGIPSVSVGGNVSNGAHAWNQVYADGEWIIVDATAAEFGYPQYMSMSEHEKLYGYQHSLNEGKRVQIERAIIESAASARSVN